MSYLPRQGPRRTDWALNCYPTVAALHQAQADYIVSHTGDCIAEAGAMGLRFNLADCIEIGRETDAARLTRQLVRHLRANGRIARCETYSS